MSSETFSPFADMLAICAVAAEVANGQTPPDAVNSARRWWDATSPADRYDLLLRACRLAALALQSAVDTAGDLWRTDHPARPRIEALIGRFAKTVVEQFPVTKSLATTSLPNIYRPLYELCKWLCSPVHRKSRIMLSETRGDFPDAKRPLIRLKQLSATMQWLTIALLRPIRTQVQSHSVSRTSHRRTTGCPDFIL